MKNFLRLALFAVLSVGWAHAGADVPHPEWSFKDLASMPIQNGGRVKPFESHARDISMFVTGTRRFEGFSAVDLLVSWISAPQVWETIPFVSLTREDTKRQIGVDPARKRFSPQELVAHSALAQYAQRLAQPAPGQKLHPRDQEIRTVLERLAAFRAVTSGEAWTILPVPFPAAWDSLVGPSHPIRKTFADMIRAYQTDRSKDFEQASRLLRTQIESDVPQWKEGVSTRVATEVFYMHVHPFLWAWVTYLLAALLWLGVRLKFKTQMPALFATGLAFALHILGMVLRSYIAGRPPVTNMYESVVWVSFGVVLFAGILHFVQKQFVGLWVATILAAIGLILGDAAPAVLDSSIRPLVPVLRSNFWLTIHVLTITLGYSAFALSLGIADVSLWKQMRAARAKIAGAAQAVMALNQLAYRSMQFGVVLLAAGTILGGVWADYSWGRFWGWDPKEVWALIALLSYLIVLHGRLAGWMGQLGFAAWTAVAFSSVVMAWYGVNFVLGVGLHSYGFSAGGRGTVFTVVGLQVAYIIGCVVIARRGKKR